MELNRAYEAQARTVQGLTRQYRALNTEVAATSVSTGGAVKQIGSLATAFTSLGGTLGVLKGGLATLGIGKFFSDIANGIDSFNKSLLDINKSAQATDLAPEIIKAIRIESEKLNVEADSALQSFVRFNRSLSDARVQSQDASREMKGNVQVLRGTAEAADDAAKSVARFGDKTVQVLRGAERPKFDISKPFKAADIDVKNYTDEQIKAGVALRDFLKELQRMEKAGEGAKANAIAFATFGRGVKEAFVLFEPILKILENTSKLKPLQGAIDNAKDYNAALVDVEKSTMAIPKAIYAALTPLVTQFLTNLDDSNKRWNKATIDAWNATVAVLKTAWSAFIADLTELWNAINWSAMWDGFVSAATKALNAVLSAAKAVAAAVRSLPGTFGAGDMPPMPRADSNLSDLGFARGGLVSGRGHGDTVRAWLTPGEFVMRRSVVDAFGANFFAGLNRGMGNLLPRNHYAAGGLVMATDAATGTPVHLHIGGHSFPMRTDSIVAESLIRTAREKQLLSAGRKPSWAGGRRYGG